MWTSRHEIVYCSVSIDRSNDFHLKTLLSFQSMTSENLYEPSPILAPLGEILCEPRRLWRHGSRAPVTVVVVLNSCFRPVIRVQSRSDSLPQNYRGLLTVTSISQILSRFPPYQTNVTSFTPILCNNEKLQFQLKADHLRTGVTDTLFAPVTLTLT